MQLRTKNISPKRAPQSRYLDPTYSSSSRNYQTRFEKTQASNKTSTQEPASSNNIDELNRIYRNNTLWEIGESQDSKVEERSPPRTRHSRRRSPLSGSPPQPRISRLVNGSPDLNLDYDLNKREFSPQSREARTIDGPPHTRPGTKSRFQIVHVIGKPDVHNTIDPYNTYVQTFEGMNEDERKATIFAEAQRQFMTKSQNGGSMSRVKQLKLPNSLIGQQRTRVDILAESAPCAIRTSQSPRQRYNSQF